LWQIQFGRQVKQGYDMNAPTPELRANLADLLKSDPLLYRRLNEALERRDKHTMAAVMRSLRLYPPQVRWAVEQALMCWLFDPEDANQIPLISNLRK
jgi:hypothetical protein